MDNLYALIEGLIQIGMNNELISARDHIYVRNRLLAAFKETNYELTPASTADLYTTLDALADEAVKRGLIEDTLSQKDQFTSTLMNDFLPAPSIIEEKFWHLYHQDKESATNYFYALSKNTNYVKANRIAKNIIFHTPSPYGTLDITINLSKPEKDPKDIARQKTMAPTTYPSCLLCVENEGFNGTSTLPDRANHRMIELHLNNRDWRLQYSPYLYYNEHCILLSTKHEPMTLTENSFRNLLSFVAQFPHYFIGSNADLPIVGGSILAHEHYQGGHYTFPLHRAKVLDTFTLDHFKNVKCELISWPLSTLSLSCKDMEELVACSNYIYEKWQVYSDEAVDILASTNGVRHNTVTPIARKVGEDYVMTLVLRNNRTDQAHPLGIFHPHDDVQHIKKENIGLIEVMGLAILPARLKTELEEVKNFILDKPNQIAPYHLEWAKALKKVYSPNTSIDTFVEQEVGKKFTRVLEDAGVFKTTPEGIAHFKQFIATL